MLRSISVNLNYLWNKFLGTRFLQLEIYKRVVTALLDPLGGGHPWLGWVLGSRAGGQLGTPVWWGQNNTTTRDHKRNPLKILRVQKRDVLAVIYVRLYGFICVLQIMSAVHVCGVCPGAI